MAPRRLVSARRIGRILAALVPFALSLSACSLLLQTDDKQCSTDEDCRVRGGTVGTTCVSNFCQIGGGDAGPLACLGSVKAPPAPPAGNVTVTMSFFDEVSQTTPLSGIAVQACARLDVTCTSPLTNTTSDGQGNATIQIPAGFDGYLEINGSTTVPALWYFSPAPTTTPPPTTNGKYSLGLLTPQSFQQIAAAAGATVDPDAGHAITFALDCTATYGTFAPGMAFSCDKTTSETRNFYFVNGLPSTTAASTDTSGIGGFANLPPGVVTLTDKVASSGTRAGSVSVLIRPGVITFSPIAPSP
jgi:hypothetical protein